MTKLYEVQTSVFERLKTISEITGVYDYVPEKTPLPYIVLGRMYSEPLNTKSDDAEKITIEIDIWSESKGKKQSIGFINQIKEVLADEIEVDGAIVLDQERGTIEVQEVEPKLYQGSITYTFKLEEE